MMSLVLRRAARIAHSLSKKISHALVRVFYPKRSAFARDVIRGYRAAGGLAHGFQEYKLVELMRILDDLRPNKILELGSGSTTSVFVDYVRRTPGAELTVVDQSRQWLTKAAVLAGIDTSDCSIRLEAADTVEDASVPAVRYAKVPIEAFDLVLIDGPSLRIAGAQRKDAINDDVFQLIDRYPPQTIVVDGRYSTVCAIRRRAGTLFHTKPSEFRKLGIKWRYQYFSIFTKRNND